MQKHLCVKGEKLCLLAAQLWTAVHASFDLLLIYAAMCNGLDVSTSRLNLRVPQGILYPSRPHGNDDHSLLNVTA